MACFLVPATEGIVTAVVGKSVDKSGKHADLVRKLGWLTKLQAGGTALLAFEHLWHGEIAPYAPFLTAMSTAEDTAEMLHEISTTGATMAVAVTLVWGVMVAVSHVIEKKAATEEA